MGPNLNRVLDPAHVLHIVCAQTCQVVALAHTFFPDVQNGIEKKPSA
jgi:hypothetical protein